MKICILGNTGKNIKSSYSWFVNTVYQGMKLNGHTVIGFDYKSNNLEQIEDFLTSNNFDIVFTHLTFHGHHDINEVMGLFDFVRSHNNTKIIHTLQDAREEPRYNGDISSSFDLALISQTENLEKFQKYWKVPVFYWPYSSLTYKNIGMYQRDLDFRMPVFTGSQFSHKDRSNFIKILKKHVPIRIIGTKSREDVRHKTQDFSVSNDCILSLSTRYDWSIKGYIDVRPFQYGGAGGILICRPHEIQKDIIPPDLYYTINNYNQSSIEKIRKYWEEIQSLTKSQKNDIRKNIFNFIQKYHSSYIRMKQTIELIQEKRNKLDVFLDDI